MANPLQELPLEPVHFQFIQEIPIDAAPAKVWKTVTNPNSWFVMSPEGTPDRKVTLELHPGGRWFAELANGTSMLFGHVTLIEPGKLLRLSGQLGATHLPVNIVVIFELQPKNDGKTTLLRLGQRTFGFIDTEFQKRIQGGWGKFLPQLKAAAEK